MPGFIPYCRHFMAEEEAQAAAAVLRTPFIARGARSREFEAAIAERLEVPEAISCGSGSAALEIALRAAGVGPGDEVIVPTLTWVATAMAVRLVGARPRFADIDPDTLNLCPISGARLFNWRTRAVIAVDFAGVPHDAAAWRELCDAHGAVLIEDAAHALGARYEDGSAVGSGAWAHMTTFSFHPAKTITCGEGGMITTRDPALAARLRRIRSGGITREFEGSRGNWDYQACELGGNHHLSEMQAAIALVQLERMDELLTLRAQAARRMNECLGGALVGLPHHPKGSCHNLYIVRLRGAEGERRDQVAATLRQRGIGVHVHYPLLHRQPVFASSEGEDAEMPHACRYLDEALTLPHYPTITPAEQERVARTLGEVLAPAERVLSSLCS